MKTTKTHRSKSELRSASTFQTEALENRWLMSTVNVANYGAKPGDTGDDTAAIQAAVDNANSGDTIQFAAGTYNVSGTLNFDSNLSFVGAKGTVLNRTGANDHSIVKTGSSNVLINGITFQGAGIEIGEGGSHITVENSTFTGLTWGTGSGSYYAVFMPSDVHDSLIQNNSFVNMPGTDTAVVGWGNTNLTITGNTFDSVNEGIHLFDNQSGNVISHNTLTNVGRMGVEVQGSDSTGVTVEYNSVSDFTAASDDGFCYALSVVTDGTGSVVRYNTLVSTNGDATPYGIEVGGTGTLVEGNYVEGFGTGIVLGDAPKADIRGNTLRNDWTGVGKYPSGTAENSIIENNVIDNAANFGFEGFATQMPGSTIRNNTILRQAGYYSYDKSTQFVGIELDPTEGAPFTVTGNVIVQTGTTAPSGFSFVGIRFAGDDNTMSGTLVANNTIASQSTAAYGVGIRNEVSGAMNGVSVTGNQFQNLASASSGSSSSFTASNNTSLSSGSGWSGLISKTATTAATSPATISAVVSGVQATLTAKATDAASETWLFGDGASATGATVTHAYNQAGTYRPLLIVRNSQGALSVVQTTLNVSGNGSTSTTGSGSTTGSTTPSTGSGSTTGSTTPTSGSGSTTGSTAPTTGSGSTTGSTTPTTGSGSTTGSTTPTTGSGSTTGSTTPTTGSGSTTGSTTPSTGSGSTTGSTTPSTGSGSTTGSTTPSTGSGSTTGSTTPTSTSTRKHRWTRSTTSNTSSNTSAGSSNTTTTTPTTSTNHTTVVNRWTKYRSHR